MGNVIHDYRTALIGALLDERAVRFIPPEDDDEKLRVEYDDSVMGQPGSFLAEVAVMGYSLTLRKSGLLQPGKNMPSIIAFSGVRPLVPRLINEAFGDSWLQAELQPQMPELTSQAADDRLVVMFDTVLDDRSVDFARAASQYSQIVGAFALLDLQKGAQKALERDAGVSRVHAVVTLRDIFYYMIHADSDILTPRECLEAMSNLDPQDYNA